jgi:serine/threonine-protein kinase
MNAPTDDSEGNGVDGADLRFPIGATIGNRYVLKRMLGRGGAASVFAAEHALVKRPVALKIPHDDPSQRDALHARLRLEASALARVRHPAIVDVVDAGDFGSVPFLAMQLLEGRTLSGLLVARGRMDSDEVIKIGTELSAGLAAAHATGLIHRDVKPSNVFVTRDPSNQVRLLDFGSVKFADDYGGAPLTQVGAIVGTPEYMAPEALLSLPSVDHRVDVYSLGVTLYELLAGAVPFEGAIGQILMKLSSSAAGSLSDVRSDVPPALVEVVRRSLSREAGERYRDMAEFGAALAACASRPLDSVDVLQGSGRGRDARDAKSDIEKRREHARAPYLTLVRIFSKKPVPIDGRIEDVSEGGVLVVSSETCTQGEVVRLKFALPISGRILDVSAVARWNRAYRGTRATGFEFQDLTPPARDEIKRYIALMGGR